MTATRLKIKPSEFRMNAFLIAIDRTMKEFSTQMPLLFCRCCCYLFVFKFSERIKSYFALQYHTRHDRLYEMCFTSLKFYDCCFGFNNVMFVYCVVICMLSLEAQQVLRCRGEDQTPDTWFCNRLKLSPTPKTTPATNRESNKLATVTTTTTTLKQQQQQQQKTT